MPDPDPRLEPHPHSGPGNALGPPAVPLDRVVDLLPCFWITVGPDERISLWNAAATEQLGVPAEEVLGHRWPLERLGWPWARVREASERARRERAAQQLGDCPYRRSDGVEGFVSVAIAPYEEAAGGVSLMFLGVDVTRARQLERRLHDASRLEAVGQLAAGIAHEINTPVQYVGDNLRFLAQAFEALGRAKQACDGLIEAARGVQSLAEPLRAVERALEEAEIPFFLEECPEAIEQTIQGVEQVAAIVRSMKALAHPGRLEAETVAVAELVEHALTLSRNAWKCVAEVSTELAPDAAEVSGVRAELLQIFLNLVVNAAHAIEDALGEEAGTGRRGRIAIRASRRDGWIALEVRDTGCGIPEEIRERIFEPFFTTKGSGRGTGQGLPLVRSLVEKHRGRLELETQAGRGSCFRVLLPAGPLRLDVAAEALGGTGA